MFGILSGASTPEKKKREQINGKNKTAEIRMDFPPQFSFIDLILDYEKNSNGKNMMKKP